MLLGQLLSLVTFRAKMFILITVLIVMSLFLSLSQAADEPAYLTVGTDVSAKYRGAFCEAKIKTVKRMVKVKVRVSTTQP